MRRRSLAAMVAFGALGALQLGVPSPAAGAAARIELACGKRAEVKAPPFDLPVVARSKDRVPVRLKPLNAAPVCAPGLVPNIADTDRSLPKANPTLAPRPGGVDDPPPDPNGKCDGVDWFGSCYFYAGAGYARTADGGGMVMSLERPDASFTTGGHTLDEIAVQGGAANGDIIELGWNVSTSQYGDGDPHLFVYHWVGGVPTCYDGCGWQQYSSTYFPGMNLAAFAGRDVYIGYVQYAGNWWAWFDNQWLGYFPGTEWAGTYTSGSLIQWFGEVASNNGVPPQIDMGDGTFSSTATAASMSALCDVDAAAWVCWYRDRHYTYATNPAYYDVARTGFGAVRYGGTGG